MMIILGFRPPVGRLLMLLMHFLLCFVRPAKHVVAMVSVWASIIGQDILLLPKTKRQRFPSTPLTSKDLCHCISWISCSLDHRIFFFARTDTGEQAYWRGMVSINMNYLAVRALHYYRTRPGPYSSIAESVCFQLFRNDSKE